jgi:hypothetical protein
MKFGSPKKEEQGEDVGSTAWLYLIAGTSVERWPDKTEILRGCLNFFSPWRRLRGSLHHCSPPTPRSPHAGQNEAPARAGSVRCVVGLARAARPHRHRSTTPVSRRLAPRVLPFPELLRLNNAHVISEPPSHPSAEPPASVARTPAAVTPARESEASAAGRRRQQL